ncbi:6-pyruvoyl tetrahydropterin synthase family protein [Dactylosporangium siamense]|uniref:6-carboxy-5,6,7,8-tetrahydropterin synthase n=1 Tax=Dactylosporangium siamense TaxID=685454 RepID=A0A919UIN6_9ACTN|nr:6-carboxytetrahydropterin synthase [Dactylosporangium siamense]GIG52870.1 hypothetical protein Dsi01nite_109110 [Dactylosporangium siamense]
MYTIGKKFTFEAAHHLEGLPDGHKCGRVHGHSYVVEVVLTSSVLTGPGFVVDFGEFGPLRDYLRDHLDHQDLNDVLNVAPTSERLAAHIYEWCVQHLDLPEQVHVAMARVSETELTFAEYTPGTS